MTKTALLKVLIVLTSHSQLGSTGQSTGYWLGEVTHPYYKLAQAGYQVDFASPAGGKAPMDPRSRDLKDAENARFLADPALVRKLETTLPAADTRAEDYGAVIFAGGHGTMWDFPKDDSLAKLASAVYEHGGIVAALCHGPAALLGIQRPDGVPLIKGKELTGFTNEEESAAGLTKEVPFSLEDELKAKGAIFREAADFAPHVVVSERLVTGQNPASATGVGEAVAGLLDQKSAKTRPFYRFFRGVKKKDLSREDFIAGMASTFIPALPKAYAGKGVTAYLPAIPPASKPAAIPDEFALIAWESEAIYRAARGTPEGRSHAQLHGSFFDREASRGGTALPLDGKLDAETPYDVLGKPVDWRSGYSTFFVGLRRAEVPPAEFLERLREHVDEVRTALEPRGLDGYLLVAGPDYEAAYLHWPSRGASESAFASEAGKAAAAGGARLLDSIVFVQTEPYAGKVAAGQALNVAVARRPR